MLPPQALSPLRRDQRYHAWNLLCIIYFTVSFLLSFLFSSLQTQSFQHSFQSLLPLGTNISNPIQAAHGQCPGGEYVNIDAVPKRSWVENMMKTATYYSVLVQSLSVAVRYRRR
ncbi:hypothetical protein BDV41DRAFT_557622 [Aspergillus transmontanensis]|uniref:Uncharacterized protein n=1 Tax=Aspergillus transmontanensis TaxID=1034304 RepID=A0A5N6VDW6_9EURO|nr:hypothetical protein BDV41DRAFT_557622 [Aspergillus transmontanensis]